MTPEHFKDRMGALRSYIDKFVALHQEQSGETLSVNAEEAARNICTLYERHLEENIRPTITSKIIQNYKIIANTELAVLRVGPFSTESQNNNKIDAQLALFIALNLLIEWHSLDEVKANKLFQEDAEIKSFLTEHYTWLHLLDTRYHFPIFSNSQVWRLFHYLIRDRIKTI